MAVDTLSLAGKVAIITGSGRETGIGAGIARALARNGAAVVINYVSDSTADRAAGVAKSIEENGGKVLVVRGGVETQQGAQKIVQQTLAGFQTDHIDILVNNAGAGVLSRINEIQPSDLERMFQVNFFGAVYMTQAIISHMPPGGRIINISSTGSKLGVDDVSIYGAAKAAVDSITYSWAKEFGRSRGITVNSLAPGPVATDIISRELLDTMSQGQRAITRAADRIGTTEDIADAVLLIASEKSRWITGQYISVSGGVTGL